MPLDQLPAAGEAESLWTPMQPKSLRNPDLFLDATFLLIRYLMLEMLSPKQVEDWLLQIRLFLMRKCVRDLHFYDGVLKDYADASANSRLPTLDASVLQAICQEIACVTVFAGLDAGMLHDVLYETSELRALLRKHTDSARPEKPAILTLRPPRASQEHLHWGFDRFLLRSPAEVEALAGESKFDKDMVGIRAVDFLDQASGGHTGPPSNDQMRRHGFVMPGGEGTTLKGCLQVTRARFRGTPSLSWALHPT